MYNDVQYKINSNNLNNKISEEDYIKNNINIL